MITKIKKVAYSIISAVLVVPALVSAATTGKGFSTTDTGVVGVSDKPLIEILQTFMNWLLGLVGVLGIIGFVVAGILYITAAGNDDRISQAKSTMTWSIVGVLVALLGLVMIKTVDSIVNAGSSF